MRRCAACASESDDGATKCRQCGAELRAAAPAPPGSPGHRRFGSLTESDARLLADGSTVELDVDGRVSARAERVLAQKGVTVLRPESRSPRSDTSQGHALGVVSQRASLVATGQGRTVSVLLLSAAIVLTVAGFFVSNNSHLVGAAAPMIGVAAVTGLVGRLPLRLAVGFFAAVAYGLIAPLFLPLSTTPSAEAGLHCGPHHRIGEIDMWQCDDGTYMFDLRTHELRVVPIPKKGE